MRIEQFRIGFSDHLLDGERWKRIGHPCVNEQKGLTARRHAEHSVHIARVSGVLRRAVDDSIRPNKNVLRPLAVADVALKSAHDRVSVTIHLQPKHDAEAGEEIVVSANASGCRRPIQVTVRTLSQMSVRQAAIKLDV